MECTKEKVERRYSGVGCEEEPGPIKSVSVSTPASTPSNSIKGITVKDIEVDPKTKEKQETKNGEMGCDAVISNVISYFQGGGHQQMNTLMTPENKLLLQLAANIMTLS